MAGLRHSCKRVCSGHRAKGELQSTRLLSPRPLLLFLSAGLRRTPSSPTPRLRADLLSLREGSVIFQVLGAS
ncbi:hypothetical protein BD310DRAFT_912799 [Dichomitus squalens]|uniref:Uncharacterized protein n=1 Tax=Dichomitus squalens TaxID=114155 RepID=A0A4Q9QE54_9APHY|nr:hypothetical protein BD310DRAFT_912799 [Dichomitus squalens]